MRPVAQPYVWRRLSQRPRATAWTTSQSTDGGDDWRRSDAEIGIQVIRAGEIVGEHTVLFGGPGERLELVHRSQSRDTFASGAIRAAKWVLQQPCGLYSMEDLLRLA